MTPKVMKDLLVQMHETYCERNELYGENYLATGKVLDELLKLPKTQTSYGAKINLLSQLANKLTRFSSTNMTHIDSIQDAAVYCVMLWHLAIESEEHKRKLSHRVETSKTYKTPWIRAAPPKIKDSS